jgi:hypothetical protein
MDDIPETTEGDTTAERSSDTPALIETAVREIVAERRHVLQDDMSRRVVRDAYRTVTDDTQHRAFREALATVEDTNTSTDKYGNDGSARAVVESISDAVSDELRDSGARAAITHEVSTTVDARDLACLEFTRTRDPGALDDLRLEPDVIEPVRRGATHVKKGDFAAALAAFKPAIDRTHSDDGAVVANVLAAWTSHWAGDDDGAKAFAEAASNHENAWVVRLVSAIANHTDPDLFRDEVLSVAPYIRVHAVVPSDSSLRVRVAYDGGDWQDMSGEPEYLRLPRLGRETAIQLTSSGEVGALPSVSAYYLAVGVVDERNEVPRTVEFQPLSGPDSAEATETLHFEPPS